MAIIILEGPDNSGKTTLAQALIGYLGEENSQYVKSPSSREREWKQEWDYWNRTQRRIAFSRSKIGILDRTPEISELVYGLAVRGYTRLRDPLDSLKSLKSGETTIIMMSLGKPLKGIHSDPMGNPIYKHHQSIVSSYRVVGTLMKFSGDGYRVGSWNYDDSDFNSLVKSTLLPLIKLDIPVDKPFQEYIELGKEIINGS